MTPRAIADALIANRLARPLPDNGRCHRTIELRATGYAWGQLYVTPEGAILKGYTRRSAKPVSAALQRQIVGEHP